MTMSADPSPTATLPWVPFSERYGIREPKPGGQPWWSRHASDAAPEPIAAFRCTCLGTPRLRCAQRATAEDRLCDECRDRCWGVTDDPAQRWVRLPRVVAWS